VGACVRHVSRGVTPGGSGIGWRTRVVCEMDFIILVKGEHRYIFLYEIGKEEEVQNRLMDCAESEDCNLEWADVLCVIKEMQSTEKGASRSNE